MSLAIFDIDGTLVPGSSERMFYRYLLGRGLQGPRQVGAYLWFWARYFRRYGLLTHKKNKAYLAGLAVEEVAACAGGFVSERLARELLPGVVSRLAAHRARGDVVLLMSGTLECIAQPLAARLGADAVRATICAESAGRYLAEPPTRHPFGEAKARLARDFAAERGLALAEATAYADSSDDLRLLKAVGRAVAVRPDRGLLRAARKRGWPIISQCRSADPAPP